MGFLELIWDLINSVNDHAKKQGDRLEREVTRASKKYERYDDSRLIETYRNTTGIERAACAMEIKTRRSGTDE